MSSEEIKAREWLKENYPNICPAEEQIAVKAFVAGIASRNDYEVELVKAIERMKCCGNCRSKANQTFLKCSACFEYSDWEMKEC